MHAERPVPLASIFNLRDSWHALRHPAPSHEPVVDGVRAIAILWVVALHAVFYHSYLFPAQVAKINSHLATGWIINGDLGVDLFFVISGLLVGSIIFREMAQTDSLLIPRFYIRRFMRIAPAYTVVMVLLLAILFRIPGGLHLANARNLWANMLYINNLLPGARQFMSWCWSLAVEEQFYLLLPAVILVFLRLGKARLPVIAGLAILSIALRFAITHSLGITLPFRAVQNTPPWLAAFDAMYDKPWVRFGGLLAGTTGAYLQVYAAPRLKQFFARARLVSCIAWFTLAIMLPVAFITTGSSLFAHVPTVAGQLWLAAYRDVFSWATIFLILAAIHTPQLLGGSLRKLLSWPGFYPIAQLSYSIYLIHEIFFVLLFPRLARFFFLPLGPYATIAADAAVAYGLTLIFAIAIYLFVEQPTMRLRSHPVILRLINFLDAKHPKLHQSTRTHSTV